MSAAQKIHASTQKFTEIVDFVDNTVILEGGNACLIIEIGSDIKDQLIVSYNEFKRASFHSTHISYLSL